MNPKLTLENPEIAALADALQLVHQHLAALPDKYQQIMRDSIAGYFLGQDAAIGRFLALGIAAMAADEGQP